MPSCLWMCCSVLYMTVQRMSAQYTHSVTCTLACAMISWAYHKSKSLSFAARIEKLNRV
jgi:hypothetical protein